MNIIIQKFLEEKRNVKETNPKGTPKTLMPPKKYRNLMEVKTLKTTLL